MEIIEGGPLCMDCENKTTAGQYKCYAACGCKNAFAAWLLGRKPRVVNAISFACDNFKRAQQTTKQAQR